MSYCFLYKSSSTTEGSCLSFEAWTPRDFTPAAKSLLGCLWLHTFYFPSLWFCPSLSPMVPLCKLHRGSASVSVCCSILSQIVTRELRLARCCEDCHSSFVGISGFGLFAWGFVWWLCRGYRLCLNTYVSVDREISEHPVTATYVDETAYS